MSIIILSGFATSNPPTVPPRQPPAPPSPVSPPAPCPTITVGAIPSGAVGVVYSQAMHASGGATPYTYTVAGALPPGLTLSPAGLLQGIPQTAGTITVAIRATDVNGCFGTLTAPLLISPAPTAPCPTIVLAPQMLSMGTVGVALSQQFTASGGTAPYTFAGSQLPAGLTLASGGVLSGTPTTVQTVVLIVVATDANGCTGTVTPVLAIQAAPPVVITLSPAVLPGGTVGTPYSQSMSASGGTGSYTFTLLAGTLPAGLTLNSAGLVSGTPTAAITAPLTIQATDAHGATGTLLTTLSTVVAGSQRILVAGDFTYLGCFRMPAGVDTTFASGNLAGRIVNGKVNLFVYGNNPTGHDPIYEITDPGSGYSRDYHTAPYASLYANWGTGAYGDKRVSFDSAGHPFTLGYLVPGNLYWNDATQLLYWTYRDAYNVSGSPDWGLGATQLIDPVAGTSFASGPWRFEATTSDGATFYGPWRAINLWTNPLDQSLLCGGSCGESGNASCPWGPDMYGGINWPTAATPSGYGNPDLVLTTRYLEHYFMGNQFAPNHINVDGSVTGALRSCRRRVELALWEPNQAQGLLTVNAALNGGVGSWHETDSTSGAIWLSLTHVRGVIFSGVNAGALSQLTTDPLAGHEWYSNAGVNPPVGACSHGFPPPIAITGPVMTAAFPAWHIYNPDDLVAVMNTDLDYTPEPTSVIDVRATYGVQVASVLTTGANCALDGFYFDPIRKYLFCVSRQVDDSSGPYAIGSIIHVFAVNDVP